MLTYVLIICLRSKVFQPVPSDGLGGIEPLTPALFRPLWSVVIIVLMCVLSKLQWQHVTFIFEFYSIQICSCGVAGASLLTFVGHTGQEQDYILP